LKDFQSDCVVVRWSPLTTTNADGAPFEMPGGADRSIQFTGGTFGAGGNIVLEGSNVGVNYQTLRPTRQPDQQGGRLAPRFMRPRVTAGDGTTSLTATLLVRRGYLYGVCMRPGDRSKLGVRWTTQRYL
jgi:hypothetical protein